MMSYQRKHLLIAVFVLIAACRSPQAPKEKAVDPLAVDSAAASAAAAGAASRKADSIRIADSVTARLKAVQDSAEQALQEAYDRYIEKYTTPCVIDTSFKIAAAKYKLHVEHVCTFDTGIVVPSSYVAKYKLDSFITHNFVTRIKLQKNGKKILDRTVTKKDFWLEYHPELVKYGVLICPSLAIQQGAIILDYHVGIPLTDIATAVEAGIDEKGGMRFKVSD